MIECFSLLTRWPGFIALQCGGFSAVLTSFRTQGGTLVHGASAHFLSFRRKTLQCIPSSLQRPRRNPRPFTSFLPPWFIWWKRAVGWFCSQAFQLDPKASPHRSWVIFSNSFHKPKRLLSKANQVAIFTEISHIYSRSNLNLFVHKETIFLLMGFKIVLNYWPLITFNPMLFEPPNSIITIVLKCLTYFFPSSVFNIETVSNRFLLA